METLYLQISKNKLQDSSKIWLPVKRKHDEHLGRFNQLKKKKKNTLLKKKLYNRKL